jgi:cold shock CspA family protein
MSSVPVPTVESSVSPWVWDGDQSRTYRGRVKWFQSKKGFGFITLNVSGQSVDVFVYHKNIRVSTEQYRFLVEGEYVEFNIGPTDSGQYQFQAMNVCGVDGGMLMCETQFEKAQVHPPKKEWTPSKKSTTSGPRAAKRAPKQVRSSK